MQFFANRGEFYFCSDCGKKNHQKNQKEKLRHATTKKKSG